VRALAAILCILIAGGGPVLAATSPGKTTAPVKSTPTKPYSQPQPLKSASGKKALPSAKLASTPQAARPGARTSAIPKPSKAPARRVVSRVNVSPEPFSSAGPSPAATPRRVSELSLQSGSALIVDQRENLIIYEKNSDARLPIASITKLMTAMVVLDAKLPLFEEVEVNEGDVDWLKSSRSRLPLGTTLTRHELLYLALVASENRAASALARSYPGGKPAFVAAMNRKAGSLGMIDTRFEDPTGLNPGNTSTAQDLLRMVRAAYEYPTIRQVTTTPQYTLALPREPGSLEYRNTNRLVRAQTWDIGLSKTGYINEAGRCLVMQAAIAERPLLIVLLNGDGRYTPFADVVRLREWLQRQPASAEAAATRTLG